MIVKKCDICGAEMRMTTPRYKVIFDGWLYTKEKDICVDCFKRIREEIKQADIPQTEKNDRSTAEFITGTQIGDVKPIPNSITTWASTNTPLMQEIQTQVIEFPDTHQKFVFARKIEMDGDSIILSGWEYKGVKDGEGEGE